MRQIIFLMGLIVFSLASQLNLILETNKNSDIIFVKKFIKYISQDYDVNFEVKRNYEALDTIIDDNKYYTNKDKFIRGLLADSKTFIDDGYYLVVKITKKDAFLYVRGVKLQKNGVNGDVIRYNLKKDITGISKKDINKILFNMLEFLVRSSIISYHPENRKDAQPIIEYKNGEYNVISWKVQNVILFDDIVDSDDIELAKDLGLVKANTSAEFAKKYCEFLDMVLPNKNYVEDDEFSLDDFFEEYNIIDGYKAYIYKIPTYLTKDFRCMGDDNTQFITKLDEYELQKLGIENKYSNDRFNVAGAIVNDQVVLVDEEGNVAIFDEEGNNIKDFNIPYLKDIEEIKTEYNNNFYIIGFNKKVKADSFASYDYEDIKNHYIKHKYYFKISDDESLKLDIKHNLLYRNKSVDVGFDVSTFSNSIIGGDNGEIVEFLGGKVINRYQSLNGKVIKIKQSSEKFVVITDKGECAIYKKGETKPIKKLPKMGFAYKDVFITDNKLLLVNDNQIAYKISLDILLKGEQ